MAKRKPGKTRSVRPKSQKPSPNAEPNSRTAKKPTGKKRNRKKSLGEMSNEERLKELGESKQKIRISSYHEAGHAVWAFLDGRLDSIEKIHVGYEDGCVGTTYFTYLSYGLKHGLPINRSHQCLAASFIAGNFSGWACEYALTKEDDPWERVLDDWFDIIGQVMATPYPKRPWQCDFEAAAKNALLHLNLEGRPLDSLGDEPMALLKSVWEWTAELFRLPAVWKVVNTLAKELIASSPGTMSGKQSQRIIRSAWEGSPKQVPMAHLGEPWVSRFGIEVGVDRPF